MNTTQGENMDLSTITTDDLLAEVARRIEGQTKPESKNWPVVNGYEMVNGYEIKPDADLRDAILRDANLRDANLMYTNLGGALVSDTTIINLPTGWKIENGAIAALEGER